MSHFYYFGLLFHYYLAPDKFIIDYGQPYKSQADLFAVYHLPETHEYNY